jgi:hypothetical protein
MILHYYRNNKEHNDLDTMLQLLTDLILNKDDVITLLVLTSNVTSIHNNLDIVLNKLPELNHTRINIENKIGLLTSKGLL